MIANHDNMLVAFCLYNEKYFEGKLLFPQFDLLCFVAFVAMPKNCGFKGSYICINKTKKNNN